VPPSLSVSVGAPPATVTTSLMLSVSATTLPTLSSPLPLLIPLPVAATEDTAGAVVSICGPVWVRPVSDKLAALPAPSLMVAVLRLTAVAARLEVFCPAPTV
jgi:hypothetical protein